MCFVLSIIIGVSMVVSSVGIEIISVVVLGVLLRVVVIGVSRLIGSILVVIMENVVRLMVMIVVYGWCMVGVLREEVLFMWRVCMWEE